MLLFKAQLGGWGKKYRYDGVWQAEDKRAGNLKRNRAIAKVATYANLSYAERDTQTSS